MLSASPGQALDCEDVVVDAERITALRDSDPGQGAEQGRRALTELQARSSPCPDGEARLLAAIGSNLHILGRYREAAEQFVQALSRLDQGADDQLLAVLHRGAGVALADAEAFDEALAHYLDALQASERMGDRLEFAKTAGNIGNLYNALNEAGTARSYHEQALAAFREREWQPGIAGSLINLGAAASKLAVEAEQRGDVDAARNYNGELLDYNQQALELFTELGNQRGIAYAESNIGLAWDRLGEPQRGLDSHQRSLALRREIGDVHGVTNSLLYMAASYLSLDRIDDAQVAVDEAESLLPEGNQGMLLDVLARRAEIDEARGDLALALARLREYLQLYRNIMEEGRRRQVLELRERFDAEQQARQIELLRQNEEISQLQLQRQRLLLQAGLALTVLALIVVLVLASRMRLARQRTTELHRLSRTDLLTGLPNRRDIIERIEAEIRRADRHGVPFCLVMADIDHFKAINDRYGHDVGDAVLVEVARRLQQGIRDRDCLARWGGEEFLLLLPDTDRDRGRAIADALQSRIAADTFKAADERVVVSLSFGVAQHRAGASLDAGLRAADQAMLLGKRDGRNRVRVAGQ